MEGSRILLTALASSLLTFIGFVFDLAVVVRVEDPVPRPSVALAAYLSVVSIGAFLFMIDRVGKSLRPVSILTSIGRTGQDVIEDVYPLPVGTGLPLFEDAQDAGVRAAESILAERRVRTGL